MLLRGLGLTLSCGLGRRLPCRLRPASADGRVPSCFQCQLCPLPLPQVESEARKGSASAAFGFGSSEANKGFAAVNVEVSSAAMQFPQIAALLKLQTVVCKQGCELLYSSLPQPPLSCDALVALGRAPPCASHCCVVSCAHYIVLLRLDDLPVL